jgi:hypothetical protein
VLDDTSESRRRSDYGVTSHFDTGFVALSLIPHMGRGLEALHSAALVRRVSRRHGGFELLTNGGALIWDVHLAGTDVRTRQPLAESSWARYRSGEGSRPAGARLSKEESLHVHALATHR